MKSKKNKTMKDLLNDVENVINEIFEYYWETIPKLDEDSFTEIEKNDKNDIN